MPDPPISSKRPRLVSPPPEVERPACRYAELHAKTNFSFLEGASHADELVLRAAELGYAALAVTDRNSLAGVVRAHGAAKRLGLKLVVGAEIHLLDAPPVVLWTTDRASYGRLARLITHGRRQAPKGEFRLSFAELAEYADGLMCGVLPPDTDADGGGSDHKEASAHGAATPLGAFGELFGDRGYLVAELAKGPDDESRLERLEAAVAASGFAAGGRRRRALSRPGPAGIAGYDHGRSAGANGGGGRRAFVRQRRAVLEIARRDGRAVCRGAGGDRPHAGDRRALHVFAGRIALRISRGARADAATRRWSISRDWPGPAHGGAIRRAFPTRCAGSSSTN